MYGRDKTPAKTIHNFKAKKASGKFYAGGEPSPPESKRIEALKQTGEICIRSEFSYAGFRRLKEFVKSGKNAIYKAFRFGALGKPAESQSRPEQNIFCHLSDALRSGGFDFYPWRTARLSRQFIAAHLYHGLFVSIIYDTALEKAIATQKP